jgi:GAF domain-containing protein
MSNLMGGGDPGAGRVSFRTVASLQGLLRFWDEAGRGEDCLFSRFAEDIRKGLEAAPELRGDLGDFSIIRKHRSLVDAIMSPVFPPASRERDIVAAVPPFDLRPFYTTPGFDRLPFFADGKLLTRLNLSPELLSLGKELNAYLAVARQFYDIRLDFAYPIIATVPDPVTGLDRHYQWRWDIRFVDITATGEVPALTDEGRRALLASVTDLSVWRRLIPSAAFEFHGFTVFNAVDVTDQEVLSRLTVDLLERDALVAVPEFTGVQEKLRALLRVPDLRLGLAALPGGGASLMRFSRKIGESFVMHESCECLREEHGHSLYDEALARRRPVLVEDLDAQAECSPLEDAVRRQGVRSLLVAPLLYHDEPVGFMELGSATPGAFHSLHPLKLRDVFPLFATALRRNNEEVNTRVQAIIKERCTAIHPSVEWRFREAAFDALRRGSPDHAAPMEEISFSDVVPLYGLSDVRDSSVLRNQAIQADLGDQLTAVRDMLLLAHVHRPMPYLDNLIHRLEDAIAAIGSGLGAGDDTGYLTMLRADVEPVLATVEGFHPSVRAQVAAYRGSLDPALGMLYRKRKDFEESLAAVTRRIGEVLDEEERKAQTVFPHYFEKYRTDGVEHMIYIGASLVESGHCDPLFIRDLRLWQLIMICRVAQAVEGLRGSLAVPLDVAHLVLAHDTPLAIRFRYDEKKFDVDGSYNIRYEILKKRIDKAHVRGTGDRLTRPGMLAVVYAQAREAAEYRGYLEYLVGRGLVTGRVEELELEELQGVQGLRALRVGIDTSPEAAGAVDRHEVQDAVRDLVMSAGIPGA